MAPKEAPAPDARQKTLFGFFQKKESGSKATGTSQTTAPSRPSQKPLSRTASSSSAKPVIDVLDSDEVIPDASTSSSMLDNSSSAQRSRNGKLSTPPTSEPVTTAMLVDPMAKEEDTADDDDEEALQLARNAFKAKQKRKAVIADDSTDDEVPNTSSQPGEALSSCDLPSVRLTIVR